MAEATDSAFPRRDAQRRIRFLGDFLGFTLGALAMGVVMLAIVDGAMALLGFSTFGDISGWICGLLAAFVFIDDFRAWQASDRPAARWIVAPIAVVLGLVFGLGALSLLPLWWAPLWNGALAVSAAAVLYGLLWFLGIRLATGERPEYDEEDR